MTREIKFRAWDTELGKWLTPLDHARDITVFDSFGILLLENTDGKVVWQQFTGLFDKNGKEIYEGDIVKGYYDFGHGKWWMTASIFYDFNGFRLKVIEGDEKREGQVNYADFIENDGTVFEEKEIIGNIYENPELIK